MWQLPFRYSRESTKVFGLELDDFEFNRDQAIERESPKASWHQLPLLADSG
jgi:hypothetical protein